MLYVVIKCAKCVALLDFFRTGSGFRFPAAIGWTFDEKGEGNSVKLAVNYKALRIL